MRASALRLQGGPLLGRQSERGAIVNGWQAAGLHALAPPVEFLRRLVGRIEHAGLLELFSRGDVEVGPVRLPHDTVRLRAEPGEIHLDRLCIFGS